MDLYYKSGALYRRGDTYFYENGTLKTVEREDEAVLYWPNGKMKRRCGFQKGVRHGLDQMWNEDGILVDEGQYEEGKPVGVHRRFGKEGQVIEEIEYLDGPRFNLRQWDPQGNLRVEAIWSDTDYREKVWDRFQNMWIEKEGFWNGKKLVYV